MLLGGQCGWVRWVEWWDYIGVGWWSGWGLLGVRVGVLWGGGKRGWGGVLSGVGWGGVLGGAGVRVGGGVVYILPGFTTTPTQCLATDVLVQHDGFLLALREGKRRLFGILIRIIWPTTFLINVIIGV